VLPLLTSPPLDENLKSSCAGWEKPVWKKNSGLGAATGGAAESEEMGEEEDEDEEEEELSIEDM
jgi:hypothetical protein